jgi:hypothetical protein
MKNTIIFSICLLFLATATSCSKENAGVEYMYEVTGTSGEYSVTLQNTDNETQQWSSVGNGWWYKWQQRGTRWLYISAQNQKSSGNVTVRIIRNGKIVKENTSYGGYTIATASGEF